MLEILTPLLPVYVTFALGYAIRRFSLADPSHGVFLLKLIYWITLPLLILSVFPAQVVGLNKISSLVAGVAVSFAGMLVALVTIRLLRFDRAAAGVLLVNTMVIGSLFVLPFVLAVYGQAALMDLVLFELGNALVVASYVAAVAFRYGEEDHSYREHLGKLMKSPFPWAVLLGLLLAVFRLPLPEVLYQVSAPLGAMTAPLIMLVMGMFCMPDRSVPKLAAITLLLRMVLGLLFGIAIASYLRLTGTSLIVVSLCAAAPVGLQAMSLCEHAGLDRRSAVSAVSISMLFGLLFMPAIVLYFNTL